MTRIILFFVYWHHRYLFTLILKFLTKEYKGKKKTLFMCGSLKAHTAQLQFLRYIPDNCQPHQSSRETLCFNYQCCRISLFPTYPATPSSNHYVRRQILTQTAYKIKSFYTEKIDSHQPTSSAHPNILVALYSWPFLPFYIYIFTLGNLIYFYCFSQYLYTDSSCLLYNTL